MTEKNDKKENVKPVNVALEAAVSGLCVINDSVDAFAETLMGKGKKAEALKRVRDYVRPGEKADYERWQEVAEAFKKHIAYADQKEKDRARISGNLRYLRNVVGVAARKTQKRGGGAGRMTLEKAKARIADLESASIAAGASDSVRLPEAGKTQAERLRLINQVLTALDSAFGCTRRETLDLIRLATVQKAVTV